MRSLLVTMETGECDAPMAQPEECATTAPPEECAPTAQPEQCATTEECAPVAQPEECAPNMAQPEECAPIAQPSEESAPVPEPQRSQFEKLPENILELVFSHLCGRDLLNAALASKHMFNVARSCGAFAQTNHLLRSVFCTDHEVHTHTSLSVPEYASGHRVAADVVTKPSRDSDLKTPGA